MIELLLRVVLCVGFLLCVIAAGRALSVRVSEASLGGFSFAVALLLGFGIGFVAYVATSLLAPTHAWTIGLSVAPTLAIALVVRRKRFPRLPPRRRGFLAPVAVVSIVLIGHYALECNLLLRATASGEGVIYQDVVYHTGIVKSLRQFGFPVPDLQFHGNFLRYHIFTHFICGQLSTVLGLSPQFVYVFLLTPLTCVLLGASGVPLIDLVDRRRSLHWCWKALIVVVAIESTFFLGHETQAANALFLSNSYQWQLICYFTFFGLLGHITLRAASPSNAEFALLFALLFLAGVTKGSSLVVLPVGLAAWAAASVLSGRLGPTRAAVFLGVGALVTVATYVVFFRSGFLDQGPVFVERVRLPQPHVLGHTTSAITGVLCLVSYRCLLVRYWRDPATMGTLAALIVGIFFYMAVRDHGHAIHFLLAILVVANALCIARLLVDWPRVGVASRWLLVFLIVLTTYPFNRRDFEPSVATFLQYKSMRYYPLTSEKMELYAALRRSSSQDDLVFTPSHYATNEPPLRPDNYYLAAFSGRRFVLGGYRFGGIRTHPDFLRRIELSRAFASLDASVHARLSADGVRVVIVEVADLPPGEAERLRQGMRSSSHYRVVFENEAGIMARVL